MAKASMSLRGRLEHQCVRPGEWLIEGRRVVRERRRVQRSNRRGSVTAVRWRIQPMPGDDRPDRWVETLEEAFFRIADEIAQGDDAGES